MGVNRYQASNDFTRWLQGLSGFLTGVKTDYGSFTAMAEHPDWDEGRTEFVIRLISSLRDHLGIAEKELADHVKSKFG